MRLEQALKSACGRPRAERDDEEEEEDNKGWPVEHRVEAYIEVGPNAPVLRGDWARDSVLLGQESRTRLQFRAALVGHKW
jgi:hypothetical protein